MVIGEIIMRLKTFLICGLSICVLLTSGCSFSWSKIKDEERPRALPEYSVKVYPAPVNTSTGIKWGYIGLDGNFLIKPTFDYAELFNDNGRAIVSKNGLYGIIDSEGKTVLNFQYDYISDYSDGLAIATDKSGYKVINKYGKIVFENKGYISSFNEGYAIVESNNSPDAHSLYGYLNREGKIVIPPQYESAGDFNNGRAIVKKQEGSYALIDTEGNILKTYDKYYVGSLSDGMISYKETIDTKYGYLDENDKIATKPKFDIAESFINGNAIVGTTEEIKNLVGVIDKKGRYVIMPNYDNISYLEEGRYALGSAINPQMPYLGSVYAIADQIGKVLTKSLYSDVGIFERGYASATDGQDTFFIDKAGLKTKELPSLKGTGSLKLLGDVVRAYVDRRYSYLHTDGQTIWQYNSKIKLNEKYSVSEEKFKPNKSYLVYFPQIQGMDNKSTQEHVNAKLKQLATEKQPKNDENLDYNYDADWAVKFFRKQLLVLEENSYDYPLSAAHGMPGLVYSHIDLKTGAFYQLKDLFKKDSNYVKKLSDIIGAQIKAQGVDSMIWADSYKGIKADQPFYITGDSLNIYFYPYEIAPYAAGFPTFKIPFKDILEIIDVEGDFYKAFNY